MYLVVLQSPSHENSLSQSLLTHCAHESMRSGFVVYDVIVRRRIEFDNRTQCVYSLRPNQINTLYFGRSLVGNTLFWDQCKYT